MNSEAVKRQLAILLGEREYVLVPSRVHYGFALYSRSASGFGCWTLLEERPIEWPHDSLDYRLRCVQIDGRTRIVRVHYGSQ
jgi:hypothetical protein